VRIVRIGPAVLNIPPQIFYAASDFVPPGGDWSKVGGAGSFASLMDDVGGDFAGADYARWTGQNGGGITPLEINFGGPFLDPITRNGFQLAVTARSDWVGGAGATFHIILRNQGGGGFWTEFIYGSEGDTFPGDDVHLDGNFTQYVLNIPPSDLLGGSSGGSVINFASQPFRAQFSFSGIDNQFNHFDWAQIELRIPQP